MRRGRGRGGLILLAAPLIVAGAIGAAAGMLVWWLLRALWFVLAVAPYRIASSTRDGICNGRLAGAEARMEQYILNQEGN